MSKKIRAQSFKSMKLKISLWTSKTVKTKWVNLLTSYLNQRATILMNLRIHYWKSQMLPKEMPREFCTRNWRPKKKDLSIKFQAFSQRLKLRIQVKKNTIFILEILKRTKNALLRENQQKAKRMMKN